MHPHTLYDMRISSGSRGELIRTAPPKVTIAFSSFLNCKLTNQTMAKMKKLNDKRFGVKWDKGKGKFVEKERSIITKRLKLGQSRCPKGTKQYPPGSRQCVKKTTIRSMTTKRPKPISDSLYLRRARDVFAYDLTKMNQELRKEQMFKKSVDKELARRGVEYRQRKKDNLPQKEYPPINYRNTKDRQITLKQQMVKKKKEADRDMVQYRREIFNRFGLPGPSKAELEERKKKKRRRL